MESSNPIQLKILTPEHVLYNESVDHVILPSALGEAGIFHHHVPFMSYLKPGRIKIYLKENRVIMVNIKTGLFECNDNTVTILTKDEINIEECIQVESEVNQKEG